MNCPRCGRHNPEDALFCLRCGQRLGGRRSGVTYRKREAGGGFGLGQTMLALLVVLLAGLVLAGGAFLVLFAGRPPLTPTQVGVVPTPTLTLLPTFEQPTASPSASTPLVTASPLPSSSASPSASFILPSPTATSGTPQPTLPPTPRPTDPPTPRPTPPPTPQPTPVDCAVASDGPTRELFLGVGNATERGPSDRVWCVHRATFRILFGSTYGEMQLLRNDRVIASADCTAPGGCPDPVVVDFPDPLTVRPGGVLRYRFVCQGDPLTPEDECADGTQDGGTIEVDYDAIDGP